MFYLAMLILSGFNCGMSYHNGNIEATTGWFSACCWLIILIAETSNKKDEDN